MALPSRVRRTFRLVVPGSYRHEVEAELRFHLEERTRELEAQGMSMLYEPPLSPSYELRRP